MTNFRNFRNLAFQTAITVVLAAVALPVVATPLLAQTEKAVAPEHNPPGDIPDSQVFIDYTSAAGFAIKVPEGWVRTDRTDGTSFVDKLDGVVLIVSAEPTAPTLATVKSGYLPAMEKSVRALKIEAVKAVELPAGPAILIAYSSNSEPNPVTNKQVRQENNRFLFYKDGKLVALDLYAPLGADNVDQWQLMSRSFTWK